MQTQPTNMGYGEISCIKGNIKGKSMSIKLLRVQISADLARAVTLGMDAMISQCLHQVLSR